MASELHDHRGHRIELRAPADVARAREGERELMIDGEPVRHGQLPSGLYFLYEYAYDWDDDLIEVAKRFIDHRERSDEIRRTAGDR